MLYFIKSGNYCKIGFSKDKEALLNRLRAYLTHNPSFQILDIRKGDQIATVRAATSSAERHFLNSFTTVL